MNTKKYYLCSIGSFNDILFDCLCSNYYLLHKDARQPQAFREITKGDTLILYYEKRCVAAGIAIEREQLNDCEKNGWCNLIHVEKWHLYDQANCKAGVSSYGIKDELESGSSAFLSVKKIKPGFAKQLLLKMLGVVELVSDMGKRFFTVGIKDIASWHGFIDSKSEITAGVPVLQRGLVWSPQQNEMLWDSLMRGLPIGSFVVCPVIKNQIKNDAEASVTHHLLDGQQRSNAIALGFDLKSLEKDANNPILWIDLSPSHDDFKETTRSFWIRITTPAHPWGYKKTDETGVAFCLATAERREAFSEERKKPKTSNLYPVKACCPVPLAYLIHSFMDCPDASGFWTFVIEKVEKAQIKMPKEKIKQFIDEGSDEQRSKIFDGIKTAMETVFVALNVPKNIFSESTEQENEQKTTSNLKREDISSIEHLFQRLNRQGTRLDGEELIFSMIKAYWPEVAAPVEECAQFRMPASRMLSLAIRTTLSESSLHGALSVSQIRTMASSPENKGKDAVEAFILEESEDSLKAVCSRVDQWLGYIDGCPVEPWAVPKVLRTGIARQAPELYLLLMYFAKRKPNLEGRWLSSLIVLLWFFDFRTTRSSKRNSVINEIVKCTQCGISKKNIQQALFNSIRNEWLLLPIGINEESENHNFESWENFFGIDFPSMQRIIGDTDLLL